MEVDDMQTTMSDQRWNLCFHDWNDFPRTTWRSRPKSLGWPYFASRQSSMTYRERGNKNVAVPLKNDAIFTVGAEYSFILIKPGGKSSSCVKWSGRFRHSQPENHCNSNNKYSKDLLFCDVCGEDLFALTKRVSDEGFGGSVEEQEYWMALFCSRGQFWV